MVYVDYDYYISVYYGTLPENSFNSLVIRASREIDNNVNTNLTEIKISNLSEEAQDKLKYTTCALVDLLNRRETSNNKKLSSVTVDGVRKDFKILSDGEFKTQKKEAIKSLPLELIRYL